VSGNVVTDGSGNSTVYLNAATTVGDVLTAFDLASGVKTAAIASGAATLTTVARPPPSPAAQSRCRARRARTSRSPARPTT